VGKFSDVKQGSLVWPEVKWAEWCKIHVRRSKEPTRPYDRASVGARKRGNARGAKGRRKDRSVNDKNFEDKSAAVPPVGAKQVEEIYGRWPWVERSVWSARMLQTLEKGVKGGKWFSLIDKVWDKRNLSAGWFKAAVNKGSAGIDGQSIERFTSQLGRELDGLQRELKESSYQPLAVKRCWIPKPGSKEKRPLGIPAVRDRIVQGALRNVLEPIFERVFAEHSYGFRPGRGCKDALRRVDRLLKEGKVWVVDLDFKAYFDTIPHDKLLGRVEELISDGRILELLGKYLKAGVMEELKGWEPTEQGTPQGAVISPLLANLYLNPLDHLLAALGYDMTRYADDLVVQCRTQAEAQAALEIIQNWAKENGLTVHPTKTRIVDASQKGGFDFLGYHFERGMKWPRQKSLGKLRDTIRSRTRRTHGQSLEEIIHRVNPTLRGWFEYFKHSHRTTFSGVDGWVRMRLRSILRQRQGKRGRGRGIDHHLWPNAYFERLGLFSLVKGWRLALQSH
jgi:RNA-directed DNA polymerase